VTAPATPGSGYPFGVGSLAGVWSRMGEVPSPSAQGVVPLPAKNDVGLHSGRAPGALPEAEGLMLDHRDRNAGGVANPTSPLVPRTLTLNSGAPTRRPPALEQISRQAASHVSCPPSAVRVEELSQSPGEPWPGQGLTPNQIGPWVVRTYRNRYPST
jgi:hypothetical protein